MRKKILLSFMILLASVGLTVGGLVAVRMVIGETTGNDESISAIDLSKDYGACNVIAFSVIKNELGAAAANLQAAQNMGIVGNVRLGDGVDDLISDTQVCVYSFAPGGTVANGFNSDNSFIVQKTLYINEGGSASQIKQMSEDPTTIAVKDLGSAAYFNASIAAEGPGATDSFDLQVYTQTERMLYQIKQPAESATFTADSAQFALVKIAQSVQ